MIKTRKGDPDALGPLTVPVALALVPFQGVFWLRACCPAAENPFKAGMGHAPQIRALPIAISQQISAGCVKKHLVGKLALNSLCLDQYTASSFEEEVYVRHGETARHAV